MAERALPDANSNNFTWSRAFKRFEHIRHQNQQIIEVRGASSNHQQRD
jgi:hypothetical protein